MQNVRNAIWVCFSLTLLGIWVSSIKPPPRPAPAEPATVWQMKNDGAKFVRATDNTRPGPGAADPDGLAPPELMDLIGQIEPDRSGLALDDLRARQRADQRGIVTQRYGSASLPQHNDVRRMDAATFEFDMRGGY